MADARDFDRLGRVSVQANGLTGRPADRGYYIESILRSERKEGLNCGLQRDPKLGSIRIIGLNLGRFTDVAPVPSRIDFQDDLAPPAGRYGAVIRRNRTPSAG